MKFGERRRLLNMNLKEITDVLHKLNDDDLLLLNSAVVTLRTERFQMKENTKQIKDWLLNGYEHDFLAGLPIDNMVEFLCPDETKRERVKQMIHDWIDNKNGCRLKIEMSTSNLEIQQRLETFMKEYL